jgi:Fic family protein
MTIFQAPDLDGDDLSVLTLIDAQRDRLKTFTLTTPGKWTGSLRRRSLARAIQGSNSIEGYSADLNTAVAVVEQEPPRPDENDETRQALVGYREALTYVTQAATDPAFEFNRQFLKTLQFMITSYSMANHPGRWRNTSVFVVDSKTGETVYTAPDVEMIEPLTGELVDRLNAPGIDPPIVRAAMAHLNLTMIHPFKDGNGRAARALQTLVIARGGLLHPAFCSIEEWLGEHTQAYYAVLAEVGRGQWSPENSARPWLRFCLTAHFQQAATVIRRNEEAGRLFGVIEKLIAAHRLPERAWAALFDAALGIGVTNARYRKDADVNDFTASRDLKRMSEAGLLDPRGEKRARAYVAAAPLIEARRQSRIQRALENPYAIVGRDPAAAADSERRDDRGHFRLLAAATSPAPSRRLGD